MADTLGEGEHGFTNAEMLLLVRERQQTYERINSARHKEQAKKLLSADMEGSAPGHVVTGDTLQNFIAQNSTLPQDVPWMLYHVEEYLVKHHQGAASKEACEQFIKEVREIVAPVVLSRTDIHGLLNMTPNEDHKVCLAINNFYQRIANPKATMAKIIELVNKHLRQDEEDDEDDEEEDDDDDKEDDDI